MIALDTDIFSDITMGRSDYGARMLTYPPGSVFLPIVTVEEVLRGRLGQIRQADAEKKPGRLLYAYDQLAILVEALRPLGVLPLNEAALRQFDAWRAMKVRIGTLDLRIAAISVAHNITLASRNRRDFERLPGLNIEFWP